MVGSLLFVGCTLWVGTLSAGCTKDPGVPFTCKCEFASDADAEARQPFTACALNANEAAIIARTCKSGTSVSVDACSCQPARAGTPCKSGCSR